MIKLKIGLLVIGDGVEISRFDAGVSAVKFNFEIRQPKRIALFLSETGPRAD